MSGIRCIVLNNIDNKQSKIIESIIPFALALIMILALLYVFWGLFLKGYEYEYGYYIEETTCGMSKQLNKGDDDLRIRLVDISDSSIDGVREYIFAMPLHLSKGKHLENWLDSVGVSWMPSNHYRCCYGKCK